jgi:hypothetical protein
MLGTLINDAVDCFTSAPDFSSYVRSLRPTSDFTDLHQVHHPARRLLKHYAVHGAPVHFSTSPWSHQQLHAAITRGSHASCNEFLDFLQEEMIDFVHKKFWTVLPYSTVAQVPHLRIAPFGVVPQHNRRPRIICDFSFYDQNADTLPLAPLEAMQFGRALERFLRQLLLADPRWGPVYMLKVDLSDGFYRVGLAPRDAPKLAMIFPTPRHHPKLIAIPLVLPMGWKNSPPIFSAVTETIADIANHRLVHRRPQPLHRLEAEADTPPPSHYSSPTAPVCPLFAATHTPPMRDPFLAPPRGRPSLAAFDVFVDDFIGACQGPLARRHYVRRVLLNSIDDVLRPLSPSEPYRKEPISVKKLRQGDASWHTIKEILGWVINTADMTLSPTPRRSARLLELLDSIPPTQRRISIRKWHRILGELRSMSIALPGSRGLFSLLQEAFRADAGPSRIRLSPQLHLILADFRQIHLHLSTRPTRIAELIPVQPTLHGAHDAAKPGAGGVFLPQPHAVFRPASVWPPLASPSPTPPPVVWRFPFPVHLQRQLATADHAGPLTNSDLELAGTVLHHEAAAQCFDVRERTIRNKTDNLAALFWARKGSATTTKPPAYLLRMLALHQRYHRYVPLHDYLPGHLNSMADDASRLWHLSDTQFLHHFNSRYPQNQSWHLFHPTPSFGSAVITSLSCTPLTTASWLAAPPSPLPAGTTGPHFAVTSTSTLTSAKSTIPSHYFKSLATDTAPALFGPAVVPSDLEQWKTPYAVLRKRSHAWGPPTHVSTPTTTLTSAFNANFAHTPKKTLPRPASNPSRCPSSSKPWPSRTPPRPPAAMQLVT